MRFIVEKAEKTGRGKVVGTSFYPVVFGSLVDAALYAAHVELETARRGTTGIEVIEIAVGYHGAFRKCCMVIKAEDCNG